MKASLCAALALALITLAPTAVAQPDQTPEESVIVTGQRTRDAVRAFVDQMAAPAGNADQLATWDGSRNICPGVAGLRAHYAQFVLDRMAQRAANVGLEFGEPGCHMNILIAVSADPDAIARDLFEHHRRLMGYYQERGHKSAGRSALRAFVSSDAPVRWWHVSRTVARDGDVIGDVGGCAEDDRGGGLDVKHPCFPVVHVGSNSRAANSSHQSFGVAFIIVDANRLRNVNFDQLADYLAMVTLAQLNPEADSSTYPTILNLFSAGANAPPAMTDWDIAYLQGLYYTVDPNARNALSQQNQISSTMDHTLTHP